MKTLCILCSGGLGFNILNYLIPSYKIEMVFTDTGSTNIITLCNKEKIDIFVGNPSNNAASNFIKNRKVNILISINYLFIVESDIISIAKVIAFNIHGSLLPKYRGRTSHVWSIINNEKKTGITAHIIEEGCDTGDIIDQIEIPICDTDTGNDILTKYNKEYTSIIDRVLGNVLSGKIKRIKQDHSQATYFGKRTPEDGLINWDWQKERIFNWIRAQSFPYPGAFTFYENKKIIIDKISYSDLGFNYTMPNGYIIDIINKIPHIKTPNGVIALEQIRDYDFIIRKNKILGNG